MASPSIILIGLRGSGKTTLGSELAKSLHLNFLDLDHLTARLLNQPSAADAIRAVGLPAFREGEVRALQSPEANAAGVLSLGGGTPTAPGAIELLHTAKGRGSKVVYLRATPATLRARLAASDHASRPSLTGAHPLDEIEKLFGDRDAMYRGIADHTIEVDTHDEPASLREIIAFIGKR